MKADGLKLIAPMKEKIAMSSGLTPEEAPLRNAALGPEGVGSGTTIIMGHEGEQTKPKVRRSKSKTERPSLQPDLDPLIRDVENILAGVDEDQATLTERYIEAGRWLLKIKDRCGHGQFTALLTREFPHRSYTTLREYMKLAKEFDAADESTKLPVGWSFQARLVCGSNRNPKHQKTQQGRDFPARAS
jgi:hypothetical protein